MLDVSTVVVAATRTFRLVGARRKTFWKPDIFILNKTFFVRSVVMLSLGSLSTGILKKTLDKHHNA